MSKKEKKVVKGILGVRKSPHSQVLLFGRYSDPLPSDDSDDSDYEPTEPSEEENEKNSTKKMKNKDFVQTKRKRIKQDRVREEGVEQSSSVVESKRRKLNATEVLESSFSTVSNAWADLIPSEVLLQIFLYCVETQGAVPLLSR